MKKMTLESITADPWNAVEQDLPWFPSATLLKAAYRASLYLAIKEHTLMMAARDGNYLPPEWDGGGAGSPDIHEYNEAQWFQADCRVREIEKRYFQKFGVPIL